jgi:hypothetical protein
MHLLPFYALRKPELLIADRQYPWLRIKSDDRFRRRILQPGNLSIVIEFPFTAHSAFCRTRFVVRSVLWLNPPPICGSRSSAEILFASSGFWICANRAMMLIGMIQKLKNKVLVILSLQITASRSICWRLFQNSLFKNPR